MAMTTVANGRKQPTNAEAAQARSSAIGKGFAVLRALRRASGPLTLSTLAEDVGIAASSVHAVLAQLMEQGVVEQGADRRYRLGPSMLYLGASYVRSSPLTRSIWLELIAAANELRVTTALAVPWQDHHLILDSHQGGQSRVNVPQGGLVPLDAGSWGKVYYCWSGAPVAADLRRYTGNSIVDAAKFADALDTTRRDGYAIDHGEFSDGVGGVCAPITDDVGYVGLASFVAPLQHVESLSFADLGSRLSALAARASLSLGDASRVRLFGSE